MLVWNFRFMSALFILLPFEWFSSSEVRSHMSMGLQKITYSKQRHHKLNNPCTLYKRGMTPNIISSSRHHTHAHTHTRRHSCLYTHACLIVCLSHPSIKWSETSIMHPLSQMTHSPWPSPDLVYRWFHVINRANQPRVWCCVRSAAGPHARSKINSDHRCLWALIIRRACPSGAAPATAAAAAASTACQTGFVPTANVNTREEGNYYHAAEECTDLPAWGYVLMSD